MIKFSILLVVIITGIIGAFIVTAIPCQKSNVLEKAQAPQIFWVQEIFIDYIDESHAGPGPHPTTESDNFHTVQGGIKWFNGSNVEYRIIGSEAISGGNSAIESAEETWDGFITTRSFSRNDSTTQLNPCNFIPNTIQWVTIDGPDGILASASICRNVATKEIGGFVISIDQNETWNTTGNISAIDVENVVSHEFGHAAGLDHVSSPKDGCLTLYRLAGLGETQKRTLGLGDKLGMNALYGSSDISAGSCGS